MPRKEFEAFTRLDASDVNTYLMDQAVQTFGGTAARGSAIATPSDGMVAYLEDSNQFTGYVDSDWYPIAGQMPVFQGIRNNTLSTTSGTKTTLTFTSIDYNRGGFTESSGIVTVPLTGWYSITAQINWSSGPAGNREIILSRGVSSVFTELFMNRFASTVSQTMFTNLAGKMYLDSGDEVRVQGTQFSGGVLTLNGSVIPASLTINYLGA